MNVARAALRIDQGGMRAVRSGAARVEFWAPPTKSHYTAWRPRLRQGKYLSRCPTSTLMPTSPNLKTARASFGGENLFWDAPASTYPCSVA